ncbi:hypothetical protein D9757_000031 [Collybiopsis confluens]|uniref:Membrane anchor Opy2 N-terminal domain-containing protein n=1 Tax=Collybiopsis confluens TaxID=2823264 RepID=A0A8H5MHJ0_9AGAR|nr:hypothetical protein D9757_000031 [Collybiopsis confluens]
MYIESLLRLGPRDCIDTNACSAPTCSCPSDQTCNFISTSCSRCSYFECQPKLSNPSSSGGAVSAGAVAGAVVGSLVFLAIAFGLFLWYRRTQRRNAAASVPQVKDVPASAADVLNRPDPMEKRYTAQPTAPPPTEMNTVRVYSTSSNTTIDLDPESQSSTNHSATPQPSVRSNPFGDNHSIQTTGTEGTNVIPIALVAPESQSQHHSLSASSDTDSSPVRPARSPELDLNLEHVNVSHDSLKQPGKYPTSTRSGISGVSRNSYMSSASYSSDFLNEAPMIITPNKGAVRQVLGVVKAEMVNAPGHSSTSSEGLRASDITRKPTIRSPLAASSFGPSDLTSETVSLSEEGGNPFSDKHSARMTAASSPAASHTTFGESSPGLVSNSDWSISAPRAPWAKGDDDSRPSSVSTQSGSVVDIVNASRVNLGLGHLSGDDSGTPTPRTPYRTTMARLVSPPGSTSGQKTFEQQQQRALAHAQAQAQAQGNLQSRRISTSSAMSGTSTRADSILESFPFVPPSPISNRPVRSPPLSPNVQHNFNVSPPSPLSPANFPPSSPDLARLTSDSDLSAPPNRKTLGLSTASQLSTASTGLGSFPFHIDTGNSTDSPAASAFNGRQRASLDTLAITSDLSSFPLGFDRDSVTVPLPGRD